MTSIIESSADVSYPVIALQSANLRNNFKELQRLSRAEILIPVKANAYGLGIEALMPLLQELKPACLGVANLYEGQELRNLGWEGKILQLGSFFNEQAGLLRKNNITPTVTGLDTLPMLYTAYNGDNLSVEVKIDTGMGRLGVLPSQVDTLIEQIKAIPGCLLEGIYTHFPSADQLCSGATGQQLALFLEVANRLLAGLGLSRASVKLHSANSYAILNNRETALDMVRPGILFYGYYYNHDDWLSFQNSFSFKPGIKLNVRPIALRKLPKGATVSYGSNWTSPRDDYPVAVLPIGYADGIPRAISRNWQPSGFDLLGNVTMDQIMIGPVDIDKPIELIPGTLGEVEQWAQCAGTTSYEILTGFGARIRRVLQ
jgi:alanine racemase